MSGNTMQYAETPDGLTALHAGTWHWLQLGERNGSEDLSDSTVTTAWETCDLSGRVPPGTVAIFGIARVITTTAQDMAVLYLRPSGSAAAAGALTSTIQIAAEQGANVLRVQVPTVILAPNGVFQYCESGTYTVDTFAFTMWGYMI